MQSSLFTSTVPTKTLVGSLPPITCAKQGAYNTSVHQKSAQNSELILQFAHWNETCAQFHIVDICVRTSTSERTVYVKKSKPGLSVAGVCSVRCLSLFNPLCARGSRGRQTPTVVAGCNTEGERLSSSQPLVVCNTELGFEKPPAGTAASEGKSSVLRWQTKDFTILNSLLSLSQWVKCSQ